MSTKLVTISLIMTVAAISGDVYGQVPRLPVLTPGVHNLMLQRPNEPPIRYAISIPEKYSPSAPVPLVLALHFGTGGGPSTGAGRAVLDILVGPAFEELGAIIVAPDAIGRGWTTAENERAVNLLLDAVIASYSIDERKIVVTGFSMGGQGTWHFAEKFPQRFSAAIPAAGRPPESAAGWKLPVLAIHSRNDVVVPFRPTEMRIAELKRAGVRAELVALTGITHYETYRFVDGMKRAVPWLREIWR